MEQLSNYDPKKILAVAVSTLLILGVVLWAIFSSSSATGGNLSISAPEGATILVRQSRTADFEEIGTTNASYSTEENGPLFVAIELDGRTTYYAEYLADQEEKEVALSLDPKPGAEAVYESSSYDFIESGGIVYGVQSSSNSINNFRLDGQPQAPDFQYIGVPFIERLAWSDKDNFTFKEVAGGVRYFRNGDLVDGTTSYVDLAQFERNQPLVLLDFTGAIVLATTTGQNPTQIASAQNDQVSRVFASDTNIFHVASPLPTSFASEAETDPETPFTELGREPADSQISAFDYSGNRLGSYDVELGDIVGVGGYGGNGLIAFNQNSFHVFENDSSRAEVFPTPFRRAVDVTEFNGELYVLTESGVWQFDEAEKSFKQVVEFSEEIRGLADSLDSVNGELHFTTTQDEESSTPGQGGIFKVL